MKKVFYLLLATILLVSCQQDGDSSSDDPSTKLSVKASSVARSVTMGTGIEVTKFILSIREVEFKVDETVTTANEVFFDGPYVLDLIDSSGALTQTIGSVEIPEGNYQTIRFKLHKTTDTTVDTDIYDRSIFLEGTINGTPFEMWHDTSENLDVGESTGVVVTDGETNIVIDFNIQGFLNQAANGGALIDLSTASDDDSDGIIELNPNSEDGNIARDLADDLKDNIKIVADLVE